MPRDTSNRHNAESPASPEHVSVGRQGRALALGTLKHTASITELAERPMLVSTFVPKDLIASLVSTDYDQQIVRQQEFPVTIPI